MKKVLPVFQSWQMFLEWNIYGNLKNKKQGSTYDFLMCIPERRASRARWACFMRTCAHRLCAWILRWCLSSCSSAFLTLCFRSLAGAKVWSDLTFWVSELNVQQETGERNPLKLPYMRVMLHDRSLCRGSAVENKTPTVSKTKPGQN